LLVHGLDHRGRRQSPGARELFQERRKAEEMVAMSMGEIDRGEILAAGDDPIQ
jgi:hypothetical protein